MQSTVSMVNYPCTLTQGTRSPRKFSGSTVYMDAPKRTLERKQNVSFVSLEGSSLVLSMPIPTIELWAWVGKEGIVAYHSRYSIVKVVMPMCRFHFEVSKERNLFLSGLQKIHGRNDCNVCLFQNV